MGAVPAQDYCCLVQWDLPWQRSPQVMEHGCPALYCSFTVLRALLRYRAVAERMSWGAACAPYWLALAERLAVMRSGEDTASMACP